MQIGKSSGSSTTTAQDAMSLYNTVIGLQPKHFGLNLFKKSLSLPAYNIFIRFGSL
jgi:hypothetical protein